VINLIREVSLFLTEELKYHESVLQYAKSLEATLWGLEEQAKFPENSSQEDQQNLNTEINKCRTKLLNCNNLIKAHEAKLKEYLDKIKHEDEPPCTTSNL